MNRWLFLLLALPWAAQPADIPLAYYQVAHEYAVPPTVLYAIAKTESGRKGSRHPHPWALNVNGASKYYDSYDAATRALAGYLAKGIRNIDVGLMQINLRYNPDVARAPAVVLDPWYNLRSGARILKKRYKTNWIQAAGHYHRPAGGAPAKKYRARVRRHLQALK